MCQILDVPFWWLVDPLVSTASLFRRVVGPQVETAGYPLVVSHGNALRALLIYLTRMGEDEVAKLEVLHGVPIRCRFDSSLELIDWEWLERGQFG